MGHHVQNLLGVSDQVTRAAAAGALAGAGQRAVDPPRAAGRLLRRRLRHFNQQYLDPGDVEEGLRAAAAIGDDMIQKQAQGYVAPESWTHGSAEMRVRWLKQGLRERRPRDLRHVQGPAALTRRSPRGSDGLKRPHD